MFFMSQPSPPRPRKQPKQSRSLMLVKAIQEACQQILEQEGAVQLTTQRIADVAGINIASLYQYFPNKEAVLASVFEEQVRHCTELARKRFPQIERLSHSDFEGTLRAIVDMEVEQQLVLSRMDPAFYRAYRHSFDTHRRVNELTIALNNPGWDDWFPQFLARHRDKLRSTDIDTLSHLATHALSGTLLAILGDDPKKLEQASFCDELYTLLLRYLAK